jgi:HK97 family phage major capsid protein
MLLPVMRTGADFRAHYRSRADAGAPPISLSDFMRGVAGLRTSPDVKNALSIGTDVSGGYSVPHLVMPDILEALVPASSLLSAGAAIVPIDEGAKTVTVAAIDAIPTAGWRTEGAAIAESEPTFRPVTATPRSLSFFFKVSRELLADSPNLENALTTVIGQALAKELDRAGLRGSGVAPEPRGILNTTGIQAVGNGANGASLSATAYANFVDATKALLDANAPMPTHAIMAPRSFTTLGGLLDTTNQPRQRPPMLADMKFHTTSQIPTNLTVGTSTDCSEIYVGDFSTLSFFTRERLTVQLARELFAGTGQIGFFAHARVDVVVQYPATLAKITGVRA